MARKLDGKIAVVTGGNSGIGLATAKRFVDEGAFVFITGRRQEDLDRLYATVKEQKGRVDIVFANAGGGTFMPLGQITEEHFDKTFGINVKGLLFTVQKALPLMPDG